MDNRLKTHYMDSNRLSKRFNPQKGAFFKFFEPAESDSGWIAGQTTPDLYGDYKNLGSPNG